MSHFGTWVAQDVDWMAHNKNRQRSGDSTVSACANVCSANSSCVAFSFWGQGAFGAAGYCFTYAAKGWTEGESANAENIACIKTGIKNLVKEAAVSSDTSRLAMGLTLLMLGVLAF